MSDFLASITEGFGNLSGDQKTQLVVAAAKVVPGIMGANQANKAKKRIHGEDGYLTRLENLEKNRQYIVNPYANVTNPYANLQVATKAADMQAEQADIALANTLDSLRQTGGGGATALAQAALKSKQGISASIEKQEVNNQKLAAQGQQRMEQLQGQGENLAFQAQEKREETQLDRLQNLIDQDTLQQQQGQAASIGSFASMGTDLANVFINPNATATDDGA